MRMPSTTMSRPAMMAVALAFASALHAGTAYLQSAGSGQSDGLSNASYWSPAIAPADADGATTDFVVQDGRTLQTATTTTSFPGKSLQLGASDFSSTGTFASDHAGELTVSDLRLYKGMFKYVNNRWMKLLGNATVYSTASAPFEFYFTGFSDGYMNIALTGDETSAIKLRTWQGEQKGADTKPLFIQANQSQTYSGSWIISRGLYLYCKSGSSSATVFGKPLSTFNPRALVMGNNSRIRYEVGSPRTFAASDNRGLWLDASGGTVTYILVNNFTHDFGWPIGGVGTLLVSGKGTFQLRATCAVSLRMEDATPKLILCNGASVTSSGSLRLPDNYMVTFESATDVATVNNLVATNAQFKFPVAADGSSCAQLRLGGDLSSLSGITGLTLSAIPNISVETDLPVIVIDSSVTREFTAADFSPWYITGAQCPTAKGVKVTRDTTTGDQIVSITVLPYVQTSISNQRNWAFYEAWAWSSGVDPVLGDGKTYITRSVPVGHRGETQDLTVPCDRLVLYNPYDGKWGMYLRGVKTTVSHLLALDGSWIWAYSYWTGNLPYRGQPHEIAGTIEVETSPGNAVDLVAARSQIKVSASVLGDGVIRARSTPSAYSPPCTVELTAANTNYVGAFRAYNDIDVVTNSVIVKISSEENLGGNPRVFAPNALELGYGSIFTPTASVTIDDPNRGVTFSASTNVENAVWAGATLDLANDFTVKTPVVFNAGAYTKKGDGLFSWGTGGATIAAGASLAVQSGAVKPLSFDALGAMSLSFDADGIMAFDAPLAQGDSRAVYGVDMRAATISHPAAGLHVRIDLDVSAAGGEIESATAPLATFATAADAQSFVGDAIATTPRRYRATLSVTPQTLGSSTVYTVMAHITKPAFILYVK